MGHDPLSAQSFLSQQLQPLNYHYYARTCRTYITDFACKFAPFQVPSIRAHPLALGMDMDATGPSGSAPSHAKQPPASRDSIEERDNKRLRLLAAMAGILAKIDAPRTAKGGTRHNVGPYAVMELERLAAGLGWQVELPSNPGQFINKWSSRLEQNFDVHDLPTPGRPHKVPAEAVTEAVKYVVETEPTAQHEMAHHAGFRAIMEKYDVTLGTLWRDMLESRPDLGLYVRVDFKKQLAPADLSQRVAISCRWTAVGINASAPGVRKQSLAEDDDDGVWLLSPPPKTPLFRGPWLTDVAMCTIYMDAKKIYIIPQSYKMYGIRGTPSIVVEDPRILSKAWVIHYYSAVNYHFGGLLLQLVTGTQGPDYSPAKKYQVG